MPEPAPRCIISGRTILVTSEEWLNATTMRHTCHICGSAARIRVRGFDLPGSARLMPHRTDGTPCR